MLKSCWDCLVGNGTRSEEPYGVQLNGDISRAPPWPVPQPKTKMFILPKQLSTDDRIIVQGKTQYDRRKLTVGLVTGYSSPDHSNVACQLDISFDDRDIIQIQIVQDGNVDTVNSENSASEYFAGMNPDSFEIKFSVRSEEFVDIGVGESHLETVRLRHAVDNIRFLAVSGDEQVKVSRIDFRFG